MLRDESDSEDLFNVQVEPIDRVANIRVESEAYLVNNDVYSFFHRHGLWHVLASFLDL